MGGCRNFEESIIDFETEGFLCNQSTKLRKEERRGISEGFDRRSQLLKRMLVREILGAKCSKPDFNSLYSISDITRGFSVLGRLLDRVVHELLLSEFFGAIFTARTCFFL